MAADESIRITLCEWAASNRDGTYTIVRGGIEHWEASIPLNIGTTEGSLYLFVEIPGGTLAEGDHDFSYRFELASGKQLWQQNGRMRIVVPSLKVRACLPIEASVQSPGKCSIVFEIAGHQATASLDIREMPTAKETIP